MMILICYLLLATFPGISFGLIANYDDGIRQCVSCNVTNYGLIKTEACVLGYYDDSEHTDKIVDCEQNIQECIIELTRTADDNITGVYRGCQRDPRVTDKCPVVTSASVKFTFTSCFCEEDFCNGLVNGYSFNLAPPTTTTTTQKPHKSSSVRSLPFSLLFVISVYVICLFSVIF